MRTGATTSTPPPQRRPPEDPADDPASPGSLADPGQRTWRRLNVRRVEDRRPPWRGRHRAMKPRSPTGGPSRAVPTAAAPMWGGWAPHERRSASRAPCATAVEHRPDCRPRLRSARTRPARRVSDGIVADGPYRSPGAQPAPRRRRRRRRPLRASATGTVPSTQQPCGGGGTAPNARLHLPEARSVSCSSVRFASCPSRPAPSDVLRHVLTTPESEVFRHAVAPPNLSASPGGTGVTPGAEASADHNVLTAPGTVGRGRSGPTSSATRRRRSGVQPHRRSLPVVGA